MDPGWKSQCSGIPACHLGPMQARVGSVGLDQPSGLPFLKARHGLCSRLFQDCLLEFFHRGHQLETCGLYVGYRQVLFDRIFLSGTVIAASIKTLGIFTFKKKKKKKKNLSLLGKSGRTGLSSRMTTVAGAGCVPDTLGPKASLPWSPPNHSHSFSLPCLAPWHGLL